jgi:glycosyltransferase involved in cell wall biosynthesis/peptidoglycan/xylan/chitin deacetylase (PgdA/CDA1 family)
MLHDLYYALKPIVPRRLQIEARRKYIAWRMSRNRRHWPIDPEAGKKPGGWPGWPDGKRFALVLTHDVERAEGQNRCHDLMMLEKSLGFRSAFNFVAEDYAADLELRQRLTEEGFEIGLHGVRHGGNIFRSEEVFREEAPRINRYLKEWKCAGFRAPRMYHDLDKVHRLDIEYDASTFDTDPFEPQPDGMRTIFPFVVQNEGPDTGYVELPYTLPQDHLLFVLMGHRDTGLWKEKLRWIAEHGGMALLITHPDYMRFNDGKRGLDEYPANYYREFLDHIRTTYEGQYWNALPRDVARYRRAIDAGVELHRNRKIHACMVSYSFYESDNRVMRYAEALAKRGDEVDVFSLREKGQPEFGVIRGVNVHRIQERVRDEKGKLDYLRRLARFFVKSAAVLTRKHMKNPYKLIHVHSVPDFQVFSTALAKLSGAKVILDIHDIVPEFYASKFGSSEHDILFKSLVAVERASIRFSDHVIIANDIWEKKLLARSVTPDKCSVFLNYPDQSLFYRRPRTRKDDRFVMMYPGTLNWHQGVDIAIRALALVTEQIPSAELHIYGSGQTKESLRELADSLGLNGQIVLKDTVPIEKIAEIMADADMGIVPKRNDSFGGEAFSTKILEFLALGIPVVVSDTKIDKFYFNDEVVRFFRSGDETDLANVIRQMIADSSLRVRMAEKGSQFAAEEFSWERRKQGYFDLVDRLTDTR